MFCPKCGQQNPDEAKFCGSCGAVLPSSSAEAPKAAESTTPLSFAGAARPAATAMPVSKGLKVGIAVGTLIIPLIGLVMGVIYVMDPNPEKKAAGKLWLLVGAGMTVLYCMLALENSAVY